MSRPKRAGEQDPARGDGDRTGHQELDLRLHLLDRQIIDSAGALVGKVDDLELELDTDGRPYVTALLCGPLALGPRFGGRLGGWISTIAARLSQDSDPQPRRIEFGRVRHIGSAVTVDRSREGLGVGAMEDWIVRHVITRIPGGRHASE